MTFSSPLGYARATSRELSYFGLVVEEKACAISPASEAASLYLRGFPPGTRHSAVAVLLGEVLAPLGFAIPPPDNLGSRVAAGGSTASVASATQAPSRATAQNSPTAVTNGLGEVVLSFPSFSDALAAHDALVGYRADARASTARGNRSSSSSGSDGSGGGRSVAILGVPSTPIPTESGSDAAGSSSAAEESQRLSFAPWSLGDLVVGFASPSDLKRCGAKLNMGLWSDAGGGGGGGGDGESSA